MKTRFLSAGMVVAGVFSLQAYVLEEDFSVVSPGRKSPAIEIKKNGVLSHGHGEVREDGYTVLLKGNQHYLAMPPVKDFTLEADYKLLNHDIDEFGLGYRILFRADRNTNKWNELLVWWSNVSKDYPSHTLNFILDGRTFHRGVEGKVPAENEQMSFKLRVKGETLEFETFGQKAETTVAGLDAGKIAFDLPYSGGNMLSLRKVKLVTDDEPKLEHLRDYSFVLRETQGSVVSPKFTVSVGRYATGETKLDMVMDGTIMAREKRDETGGCEWTCYIDRYTSPYVRFGSDLKFKFWEGVRQFNDPEMMRRRKPKNGKPVKIPEWPVKRSYVVSDFPADYPLVAAGYEYAICSRAKVNENGPWEQVRNAKGEKLWEGEAIGKGKIAYAATSPEDKAVIARIPKTIPEYERCVTHAKRQHHFLETEKIRFTMNAVFNASDFSADEVLFAPNFENVFGEPLEDGSFSVGDRSVVDLGSGLSRISCEISLDRTPPIGIYRLRCGVGFGSDNREERTEFEVLAREQGGVPPPLASGLPFLFAMPNETKYYEEDIFDPFCDRGGADLYNTAAIYYPVPGMKKHVAEALHVYDRKWFAQTHSRNSGERDCRSDKVREVLKAADCTPLVDDNTQPDRLDLTQQHFYYGKQLRFLVAFLKEKGGAYTFRKLDLASLEKRLAEKSRDGLTDDEFVELFETCWRPFVEYARAENEKVEKEFLDYMYSVNPKIGRGEYGPMAVYTSYYKTDYWLELASKPLGENDPRQKENDSFWVFEEYHHSCDYPIYRAGLFAACYSMNHPNSRKLYPEIYYSAWGRCNDGAVFQAHPGNFRYVAPEHQRRIAYQFAYGTPYFKRGKRLSGFGYWRDYGFHASGPTRADIDEFVAGWKNVKNFKPQDPLKSPFVIVDHDAFASYGDYLETDSNFKIRIGDQAYGQAGDVCNLAEEAMAFTYERLYANGYNNPVVTSYRELDDITSELAEFVVLPPVRKGMKLPANFVSKLRRLHERGVGLLLYGECDGLEDLFGVKKLKEPKLLTELRGDHFTHKLAWQRYEAKDAKALDEVTFVKDDGKGRTAFINVMPTTVNRHTYRERYTRGQPVVGKAIETSVLLASEFLTRNAPAVKTERGNIIAFTAKCAKGIGVVVQDDPAIYGPQDEYPVSFRFTVCGRGVGRGVIGCEDADFDIVESDPDRVVIRTEIKRDAALFFNIRPPHPSTYLAEEELRTYIRKATGKDPEFEYRIGTLDTMVDLPAGVEEKLSAMEPYESYYSAFRNGTLWIVGKEEPGEVYGVYHFLEEKLGVRWFKAPIEGDDGEYIPEGLTGFVPPEYECYRSPDYLYRTLSATGVYQDRIPEKGMSTAMRNGFQIHPMYEIDLDTRQNVHNKRFWDFFRPRCSRRIQSAGGGHCLFSYAMDLLGGREEAFKRHPEYFALVGGKRVHRKYPQYCLSNPDFKKLCIDYYLGRFEKIGGEGTIYFCAEDVPDGWCECEGCLKMDGSTDNRGKPLLEVSTRYGKFCKELADAILARYPKATLIYMPYSNFRHRPEGVEFDSRMSAQYCIGNRCWAHELDDPKCPKNVDRLALFHELAGMGIPMHTYEYKTCSHLLYGGPTAETEVHDLRFMHDELHSIGWNNEASYSDSHWISYGGNTNFHHHAQNFPSNWFWLNAAGHALWNCHLDLEAFTVDRESKYYGPAYPAMKKYQDLRRKLWRENRNHMGYPAGDSRTPTVLLAPGAKELLLAYLDEADALLHTVVDSKTGADMSRYLSRVRLDRQWLGDYWIKPSDIIKERMKNPVVAAPVAENVKVDGVADEASWSKACEIDNFLVTACTRGGDIKFLGKKAPDAIKMTAKIMRDQDAFYVYIDLANPEKYDDYRLTKDFDGSVWGDDEAVELFFYPPTDENKYYQIAVNALGTVFDAKCPPCDAKYNIGVTAATKLKPEGGCTMEIRVPVSQFATFVPGENWRLAIVRDLKMKKSVLGTSQFQALGGVVHTDTSNYWPLEIR